MYFVAGSFAASAGSARSTEARTGSTEAESRILWETGKKAANRLRMGWIGGPEGKIFVDAKAGHGWPADFSWWRTFGHDHIADGLTSQALGTVVGYRRGHSKMYSYQVFDSTGEAFVAKGTVSGDTWTWNEREHDGWKDR